MNKPCEHCNESADLGYSFCSSCGRPTKDISRNSQIQKIESSLGITALVIFSIFLIFQICVAVYGAGLVIPEIRNYSVSIFVVFPIVIEIFSISGVLSQIYYILILIATIASFIYLAYVSADPLKKLVNGNPEPIRSSSLYAVITLFVVSISVTMIFNLLLTALGIGTSVPPIANEPVWEQLFTLLNASVWEEIVSRALLIGVPLMVIFLAAKKTDLPWWKYLLGGFGLSKVAVAFIFVSAIMFGIAHVPGWDIFKFPTSFVAGLAFGYLFVRFGLYAAIMMHFLVDYLNALLWIWPTTGANIFTSLLILLGVIIGTFFIYVYAKRGITYLKNEFLEKSERI